MHLTEHKSVSVSNNTCGFDNCYYHGLPDASAPVIFCVTAGEASKLKLDYSLTNEQSTKRTKAYTDVIIGHDGQQRERGESVTDRGGNERV